MARISRYSSVARYRCRRPAVALHGIPDISSTTRREVALQFGIADIRERLRGLNDDRDKLLQIIAERGKDGNCYSISGTRNSDDRMGYRRERGMRSNVAELGIHFACSPNSSHSRLVIREHASEVTAEMQICGSQSCSSADYLLFIIPQLARFQLLDVL
jgi:hypothetical protein